jgi:hypothetical protein
VDKARWYPGDRPDCCKIRRTGEVKPKPSGVMSNCRFLGEVRAAVAAASALPPEDDDAGETNSDDVDLGSSAQDRILEVDVWGIVVFAIRAASGNR